MVRNAQEPAGLVRSVVALGLIAMVVVLSGCVRRTISITSEPPGALVWVNDREIGRTPVDVDFLYYGRYDVRLERAGYEPVMSYGEARAPLWDTIPFDFVSEILPADLRSRVHWHYELTPLEEDRAALVERARTLRQRIEAGAEDGAPPSAADESGD